MTFHVVVGLEQSTCFKLVESTSSQQLLIIPLFPAYPEAGEVEDVTPLGVPTPVEFLGVSAAEANMKMMKSATAVAMSDAGLFHQEMEECRGRGVRV